MHHTGSTPCGSPSAILPVLPAGSATLVYAQPISMSQVEFHGVSKSYAIYDSPGDRLKELITPKRYQFHRDFWALRDVTFDIRRGETFCIVGENGSGKSTLLQIVAGILQPSAGTVSVAGRVAALLELGSGFNPEFS